MKLIIILFYSFWALPSCPLKTPSLDHLQEKALEIKAMIPQVALCEENISIKSNLETLSGSLAGLASTVKTKNDEKIDKNIISMILQEQKPLVSNSINSIKNLINIFQNQNVNDACSNNFHSSNFFLNIISIFNEISPMVLASSPTLAPYADGVKLVGQLAEDIAASSFNRKQQFAMHKVENRKTFIQSSCLLYDLGVNIYEIERSLENDYEYFDKKVKNLSQRSNDLFVKILNNPIVEKLVKNEIQQINSDIREDLKKVIEENNTSADDDPECEEEEGEEGAEELGEKKCKDSLFGKDGKFSKLKKDKGETDELTCKLINKYMSNITHHQNSRISRLKTYLEHYQTKFLQEENELASIRTEMLIDELLEYQKEITEDSKTCNFSSLEKTLSYLENLSKDVQGDKNIAYSDYNSLKNEFNRNQYYLKLALEKIKLIKTLSKDSASLDLSETYVMESNLINSLFSGKRSAYYWLLYKAERGLDFAKIFSNKIKRKEYRYLEGKQKKCLSIQGTIKEYRNAQLLLKSSQHYCKTMNFLTSKTEHKRYTHMCDADSNPKMAYHSPWNPMHGHAPAISMTSKLKIELDRLEKDYNNLETKRTELSCGDMIN